MQISKYLYVSIYKTFFFVLVSRDKALMNKLLDEFAFLVSSNIYLNHILLFIIYYFLLQLHLD